MNTQNAMTELTKYMYDRATSGELSLQQAAAQLKYDACVRTVRDTLAAFTGIPAARTKELQSYLTDRLMECTPGAKRDSVERKVRMWMKDDALTVAKEGAIQLGFALGLSVGKADELLTRLCGEGFHWRDPEEIVYIYALMHGMSYPEASALYDHMAEQKLLEKRKEETEPTVYTEQVRASISRLSSTAELEEFLRTAQNSLGKLHNTAYALFRDFLDLLRQPETEDEEDVRAGAGKKKADKEEKDRTFPDCEILTTYLYLNFIPRGSRSGKGAGKKEKTDRDDLVLTALRRGIRQNWPDAETLSKMLNRKTDVTRKVLILLFLATDGGMTADMESDGFDDYDEYDDYDDDPTPEEMFEDMYARMNSMLSDCGFAMLDPRVPFDWMMMYCMCADDSIFIDGRVQHFLSEIFSENGTETTEFAEEHYDERKWISRFNQAL